MFIIQIMSSLRLSTLTWDLKPNMILIVTNYMEVEKAITHIALVNDNDQNLGYEDKLKVHQEGLLHRAFSVVVVNGEGQWLLHRRALDNYHSGGTWTNTGHRTVQNYDREKV